MMHPLINQHGNISNYTGWANVSSFFFEIIENVFTVYPQKGLPTTWSLLVILSVCVLHQSFFLLPCTLTYKLDILWLEVQCCHLTHQARCSLCTQLFNLLIDFLTHDKVQFQAPLKGKKFCIVGLRAHEQFLTWFFFLVWQIRGKPHESSFPYRRCKWFNQFPLDGLKFSYFPPGHRPIMLATLV